MVTYGPDRTTKCRGEDETSMRGDFRRGPRRKLALGGGVDCVVTFGVDCAAKWHVRGYLAAGWVGVEALSGKGRGEP